MQVPACTSSARYPEGVQERLDMATVLRYVLGSAQPERLSQLPGLGAAATARWLWGRLRRSRLVLAHVCSQVKHLERYLGNVLPNSLEPRARQRPLVCQMR